MNQKQSRTAAVVSLVIQLVSVLVLSAQTAFVHPGCLSTQSDIDRIKTKVAAGAQPWAGAWSNLVASPFAQNTRVASPVQVVVRGCSGPCTENYTSCMRDAAAAYQNALRYAISGDTSYANCAVNILNAWASTMTTISTCCSDHYLLAGLQGYQFACAAELLRGYSGWAPADFTNFKNWMRNIWYADNHDFLVNHNGACISHYWCNWDACNMASMISIGVLLDDTNIFNEAVSYYKTGAGNGALEQAVYFLHGPGLGQWQESGRDQDHTLLGLGLLGVVCEVAWNQGVDLYGYTTPSGKTLYDGIEYVAKYNLTNAVPYTNYNNCDNVNQTVISSTGQSINTNRYYWDMIYNAYLRKNVTTTYAAQAAAILRPDFGGGHGSTSASWAFDHLGFTTLTHYLDTTSAPPAPTGLMATGGDNLVTLNWTASSGATSYNVKRATVSGGPYTLLASGVTTTSYSDTAALNGTTYHYVVSAVDSGGESPNSGEASATPSAPSIPNAPTGLTASAGRKKVTLTWTQSTSPNITINNIYRATASSGPYTQIASIAATTSYSNTGLTAGITYYYVVTAVNSGSLESSYSNEASAAAK